MPKTGYSAPVIAEASMPASQPVSPQVVEMARRAVKDFHECFWWWNPEFIPQTD